MRLQLPLAKIEPFKSTPNSWKLGPEKWEPWWTNVFLLKSIYMGDRLPRKCVDANEKLRTCTHQSPESGDMLIAQGSRN